MGGAPGGRRRDRRDEQAYGTSGGYGDELWTIPEGAPSVVESTEEPYEPDPGPALGR